MCACMGTCVCVGYLDSTHKIYFIILTICSSNYSYHLDETRHTGCFEDTMSLQMKELKLKLCKSWLSPRMHNQLNSRYEIQYPNLFIIPWYFPTHSWFSSSVPRYVVWVKVFISTSSILPFYPYENVSYATGSTNRSLYMPHQIKIYAIV